MTINYRGKLVLAPMVRSGELPTRLLSLIYGADLVWTPEIVDKKIITCDKSFNQKLNTTEYVDPNGKIIFNTYKPLESGKLIFQMGSASPDLAVQAGLKVIEDVDGIDLNCGCPKNFSVHSGMGAALLSNSKLLCDILENLVQKVGNPNNKPISCKIRLMKDLDSTLELVEKICQTGIKNLTLHCRTRDMRNRQEPIHDYIPHIIKLTDKYDISFIINGNLLSRLDYENLKTKYGSKISGMIAEGAEGNPSIFNLNPLPWNKLVLEFLKICTKFDNHPANSKYVLLNQIPSKSIYYQVFAKLKTNKDLLAMAEKINDPSTELEEEKFIGKIKFRYLQKDKMMSIEEYNEMKANQLKDEPESEPIAPLDFNKDFTDVNNENPKIPEIESKKRKVSFDEPAKKVVKT